MANRLKDKIAIVTAAGQGKVKLQLLHLVMRGPR